MSKAVTVVKLVSESSGVSSSQIVKETLAKAEILWAAKIKGEC